MSTNKKEKTAVFATFKMQKWLFSVVRATGLEPACLSTYEPKGDVTSVRIYFSQVCSWSFLDSDNNSLSRRHIRKQRTTVSSGTAIGEVGKTGNSRGGVWNIYTLLLLIISGQAAVSMAMSLNSAVIRLPTPM